MQATSSVWLITTSEKQKQTKWPTTRCKQLYARRPVLATSRPNSVESISEMAQMASNIFRRLLGVSEVHRRQIRSISSSSQRVMERPKNSPYTF